MKFLSLKILIVGESSVGKSSLMARFVDETFQTSFLLTVGVDYKVRTLMIDNYRWTLPVRERFRAINTTYYRDAAGVIIVYDVTNAETFACLRRWIDEVNTYCPENIVKVLVGNKDELHSEEKVVSTVHAQEYARQVNLPLFEASVKENRNVPEIFYAITRLALQQCLEARKNRLSLSGRTSLRPIQLKEKNVKHVANNSILRNKSNQYIFFFLFSYIYMPTRIDPVQTFKILIVGDSNVGKTSLMNRMVHGVFSNHHAATIGIDFKVATVNIGEYKCRLQIWDTAGQERFRSMTSSYYRGADGILIIYDVTNNESFGNVKTRFPELDFYCDETVPRILVGNKDDNDNQLNKVVRTRYARELAEQNNLVFFQTSVKDNKNVTEVFQRIAKLALKRRLVQSESLETTISINRTSSLTNKPKKRCCLT